MFSITLVSANYFMIYCMCRQTGAIWKGHHIQREKGDQNYENLLVLWQGICDIVLHGWGMSSWTKKILIKVLQKLYKNHFLQRYFFLSFWVKFETVFVGYFFKIYKSLYYETLGLSILSSVIDVLTTFYVRFIIFLVFAFGTKLWVLTCQ